MMKRRIAKINPFYSEYSSLLRITPGKILTYIFLMLAIELETIWIEPAAGVAYYGVLTAVLLHHYLATGDDPNRGQLLVLASIPLMRLISLAMPVGSVPPLYRYPMVGIPVLISLIMIVRSTGISARALGLRLPEINKREDIWENILIAVSGIPLGIIGFYFGDPIPLVTQGTTRDLIVGTVIIFVFIGTLEEILFRGLLLQTMRKFFGQAGVVFASGIYLLFFASSGSIGLVVLMGFVSLLYSWHMIESKSVLAISISHSLMAAGMLIFYPLVF